MENAEYYQKIAYHIAEIHKRIKRMQSLLLREYDISLPEYHILAVLMKKQQITQKKRQLFGHVKYNMYLCRVV